MDLLAFDESHCTFPLMICNVIEGVFPLFNQLENDNIDYSYANHPGNSCWT